MAKDKKGHKLPKKLAGVKIPRNVRDGLVKLAHNPLVADLLAAGLVALAASLRDGAKPAQAAQPKPEPEPAAAPKPVRARKPAAAKAAAPKAAAKAKAPAKPKAAPKKPVIDGTPVRKPTVRATSTKH
jgi:hypothetical protein